MIFEQEITSLLSTHEYRGTSSRKKSRERQRRCQVIPVHNASLLCSSLLFMAVGELRQSLFFKKSSLPGQCPHRKYITVGCVCYTARSVKYTGDALLCPVTRWQLKILKNYHIDQLCFTPWHYNLSLIQRTCLLMMQSTPLSIACLFSQPLASKPSTAHDVCTTPLPSSPRSFTKNKETPEECSEG